MALKRSHEALRCSILAGLVVGAMIGSHGNAGAQTPPARVFKATADSYVESGANAGTNFGTSYVLKVGTGSNSPANNNVDWSYLKFDLSTYTGPVLQATLVLYGSHSGPSPSDVDSAYGVPNNTWTNNGITWLNKPALGPIQGSAVVSQTAGYYSWDVTSYVKTQLSIGSANKIISLAVTPGPTTQIGVELDTFASSRSNVVNAPVPQLIISAGP